jgi:hypothetical protein
VKFSFFLLLFTPVSVSAPRCSLPAAANFWFFFPARKPKAPAKIHFPVSIFSLKSLVLQVSIAQILFLQPRQGESSLPLDFLRRDFSTREQARRSVFVSRLRGEPVSFLLRSGASLSVV